MKLIFPESHLNKAYIQGSQSSRTQFSFLNKQKNGDLLEVFPLVMCRDYFGDALFGKKFSKNYSVYGFTFDPKEHHIDDDATRLLLHSPNKKELDTTLENWGILTTIEDLNDIPRSTVTAYSQDGRDFLIIEGDNFWQSTMWLISLYTYIIRCLCTKQFATASSEANYMRMMGKNWDILTQNIRKVADNSLLLSGWPNEKDLGTLETHNRCGFLTLFCLEDNSYGNRSPNIYYQNFQKVLQNLKNNNNKGKSKSAAAPATPS